MTRTLDDDLSEMYQLLAKANREDLGFLISSAMRRANVDERKALLHSLRIHAELLAARSAR